MTYKITYHSEKKLECKTDSFFTDMTLTHINTCGRCCESLYGVKVSNEDMK